MVARRYSPRGGANQRGEVTDEVGLVVPAVGRRQIGEQPVPVIEGGEHVVHPVAGKDPLRAHPDVAGE